MKKIYASFFLIAIALSADVNAQCHYIPATSTAVDTVTWNFAGGAFQSFGCAPIDPTYWMNNTSCNVTATFVMPQNYPGIRVWGMNDDDSAAVYVNGVYYPLNSGTGEYLPKVVCGLSPGPDGVVFANGKIVGANTNTAGNFSYSDVVIYASNVNTISVHHLNGAGWGFAGVILDCQLSVPAAENNSVKIFPSPVKDQLFFDGTVSSQTMITITDISGKEFRKEMLRSNVIDVADLAPGVYFMTIVDGSEHYVKKFTKM